MFGPVKAEQQTRARTFRCGALFFLLRLLRSSFKIILRDFPLLQKLRAVAAANQHINGHNFTPYIVIFPPALILTVLSSVIKLRAWRVLAETPLLASIEA